MEGVFYRSSDLTNNVGALKEEISVSSIERMLKDESIYREYVNSSAQSSFPLIFFEILGRKHFRLVFFLFFCLGWTGHTVSTCNDIQTIATLAKYTQSQRARAHTILGAYATINQPSLL